MLLRQGNNSVKISDDWRKVHYIHLPSSIIIKLVRCAEENTLHSNFCKNFGPRGTKSEAIN